MTLNTVKVARMLNRHASDMLVDIIASPPCTYALCINCRGAAEWIYKKPLK